MRPKDWLLFVALGLAGFALGRWQNGARNAGRLDPVTAAIQAAARPIASLAAGASDSVGAFLIGVVNARSLTEENRALKAQVQALQLYAERERALAVRLTQLEKLAKLRVPAGRTRVPAVAIGLFPYENRMSLNVGENAGVRVGLPVVTGEGLLGIVQTVSSTSCQVGLLASPSVRVGGMVLRDPPQFGIVKGYSATSLLLDFMDIRAQLAAGDWVVTSGFSQDVPRGIPIGRIISVERDPDFGTLQARIAPHVRVGLAREVYVLR